MEIQYIIHEGTMRSLEVETGETVAPPTNAIAITQSQAGLLLQTIAADLKEKADSEIVNVAVDNWLENLDYEDLAIKISNDNNLEMIV